jgi:hypothetical protein
VQAPFTGLTTAFGVTTDAAGNVYFTGNTTDSGHLKNVVLVKFSGAGDLIWSKVGGPGFGTGQNLPIALEAQNGQILPFESTSLGGDDAFTLWIPR